MAAKVRKQFLLDPELLRRVRVHLGAKSDTEAVERALRSVDIDAELHAANLELVNSGIEILDVYGRLEGVDLGTTGGGQDEAAERPGCCSARSARASVTSGSAAAS